MRADNTAFLKSEILSTAKQYCAKDLHVQGTRQKEPVLKDFRNTLETDFRCPFLTILNVRFYVVSILGEQITSHAELKHRNSRVALSL